MIKKPSITSEETFNNRRTLIKKLGIVSASLMLPKIAFTQDKESNLKSLKFKKNDQYSDSNLLLTPENKVTTYNNFYELGWDKSAPSRKAHYLKPKPWQLKITGEVENPITLTYDDLLMQFDLEERIYRFRCVEAWSMVIPWIGFELNQLLSLVKPNNKAKFIRFKTLYDSAQMPNLRNTENSGLMLPYQEGLRLDEAMHPLTILSVGLYGKILPNQNGAPIRLVVPWKYGFKSIKSIVGIELISEMPETTWQKSAPHEYGFYANVNPDVSHPRWSQASERVIGTESLFSVKRIPTLPFNGYEKEVKDLYAGMDLTKDY